MKMQRNRKYIKEHKRQRFNKNFLHLIGIPGGEKIPNGSEIALDVILDENYKKLTKDVNLCTQEALQTPIRINIKKHAPPTLRCIIADSAKTQTSGEVLKPFREKRYMTFKSRNNNTDN